MARQEDVGCEAESRTFLAKNSLEAIFGTIRRNFFNFSKANFGNWIVSSIPSCPTNKSRAEDVAHN